MQTTSLIIVSKVQKFTVDIFVPKYMQCHSPDDCNGTEVDI